MVACRSADSSSAFIKIFENDGHMLLNSCGGKDRLHPRNCPTTGAEIFNQNQVGTPLIAEVGSGTFDNSVIVADDHAIVVFRYTPSSDPVYTPYVTLFGAAGACSPLKSKHAKGI